MRKIQLAALVAVPVLCYFALIAGAATYPGYSHVTRYASELGMADAPYPDLFNYSVILGGIAALLGAVGLAGALRDLSGGGCGRCLVTRANVGIWQRINSAFGIPWLAVIGIWLLSRDRDSGSTAAQA